ESIEPAAMIDDAPDPAFREFISEIMMTKYQLSRETREGGTRWEPGEPRRIAADSLLAIRKKSLRARKLDNQEEMKKVSARGEDVLPYMKRNTVLDEELAKLEKEGLGTPPGH
ncbi:MAG TPA: hypothetical protein VJO14_01805, partial [Bacteroidota bacterium]|nr:hypothetical protein [Bacteroidota bacterium]